MNNTTAFAVGFALFLGLSGPALAQKPAAAPLAVYISVDMEGIAGVVTADQLMPQGFEYERARHFMTNEVLAAVRAAKVAGATKILIADSHGNGESLLIDEFRARAHHSLMAAAWRHDGGASIRPSMRRS